MFDGSPRFDQLDEIFCTLLFSNFFNGSRDFDLKQGYQEFRASNPPRAVSVGSSMGGLGTLLPLPVEAKNPTLHFKLQLTAHVEKIYKLVLDNLKKEVTPLLGLCVQV